MSEMRLNHEQVKKAKLMQLGAFLVLLLIACVVYYFLAVRSSGQLIGLYPIQIELSDFFWLLLGLIIPQVVLFLFLKLLPSIDMIYDPNVRAMADIYSLKELISFFFVNAFMEELLFRGAIQYAFGLWPAVILFTLAHISYYKKPIMLAEVFVLAVFLGAFYQGCQSIWICTICHAFYNWFLMWLIKTDRVKYYPVEKYMSKVN